MPHQTPPITGCLGSEVESMLFSFVCKANSKKEISSPLQVILLVVGRHVFGSIGI